MSLQKFKLPDIDTRIIKHSNTLYKFKFQFQSDTIRSSKLPCDEETIQKEIQNAVRVVIKNPDELQPMKTDHFLVFPYKKPWKTATRLEFFQNGTKLNVFPNIFHIYLTENTEKPVSERINGGNGKVSQQITDNAGPSVTTSRISPVTPSMPEQAIRSNKPRIKKVKLKQHHGSDSPIQSPSTKLPRYALRKRPAPSSNNSQEPSSKRATRTLYRKQTQSKAPPAAIGSDRSPPPATGADMGGIIPGVPEGGVVLPSKRPGRDDIQQDVLDEMMRLQNLARPLHIAQGSSRSAVASTGVTARSQRKKSVLESVLEVIVTPAKMLLRRKK
ncbi:uncharacterized protein LOC144453483 [Glandiceps talaboti]